jgi:hypothetical protein
MAIRLFIKFGAKEHLEKMQREGILYCNTITYFSKVEDNNRGDAFESVTKLNYLENPIFQLRPANDPSAEWKNLNVTNMLYQEYYKEPLGNLFCFSGFKINPSKKISIFHIDEKFLDFGYGLMVLRQDLFMERLKKSLAKLDIQTCMKTVEYLDLHKYSGKKIYFKKILNTVGKKNLELFFILISIK